MSRILVSEHMTVESHWFNHAEDVAVRCHETTRFGVAWPKQSKSPQIAHHCTGIEADIYPPHHLQPAGVVM